MARIFISYKRADKEKVFPLKNQIEAAIGEPCWIDLDGIESDAQFAEKIMRSIDAAEIFLFMYSVNHSRIKNYTTDWTVRELNYALKKEKRIVFVNIDGTKIIDWLDFMFPQQQQVDATNPDSLRHLLHDLQTWLRVKPQDTPHQGNVQPQPVSSHVVRVYGYKEWYLIRPAVAVYRNGEKIGKLAYDSYMDIECVSERDILHFRYGLNSCQFVVDPSFTGALQLVTNRFTSTISVEVI